MNPTVRRSRMRPARPLTPFLVSVLVLLVWWAVAHNSGSGWVQAIGDVVFGMLVIGTLGPAVALVRVRVELVHAPADTTADMPVTVRLSTSTRARVCPLEPAGPAVMIGPRTGNTADEDVTLIPDRRGVHEHIVVEVATAAPFGLQWWARRVAIPLAAPLHIAPRMGEPGALPRLPDEQTGHDGAVLAAHAGETRGVRDYRAGDRRRRVHWPATAHAGRLMVREMEAPPAGSLRLQVSLPHDSEAAERAAENALATAVAALDRGMRVEMSTDEAAGPVTEAVGDRRTAGRRLARAVAAGDGPHA